MLRKGRLWKPCKKCGEMYSAHTKAAGICDKCNPNAETFLNRLAREQRKKKNKD